MKAYLHIGAGKTGTSAIQAALSQNRATLAEAGLFYPELPLGAEDRALRGVSSSGNARLLGWFCNRNMKGPGFTEEAARDWIAESARAAAGRTLLFSSEMMQFARPQETGELIAALAGHGYETEVIFYARHLLDHAVAEYLQHVKMAFATLAIRDRVSDLPSFLPHYRCGFARVLRSFAEHLPKQAIHVRLYDAEKAALVPRFFAILGLRTPAPKRAIETVVNRSPMPEELPIFEALARQPDGLRLCRTLSDLVLNAPSESTQPFVVPQPVFDLFSRHNQAALDEMNTTWLTGADKLAMRSDRILIGPPPTPSAEELATHYATLMATALRNAERGKARQGQGPMGQRPPGQRPPGRPERAAG